MNRRSLLTGLMLAGNAVLGAVIGIPAMLLTLSPAWQATAGPRWRRVGRLNEDPVGSLEKSVVNIDRGDWSKSLDQKSVYVWRVNNDQIVVYSRNCTDLSCPVHFDSGSECFLCPCHGGIFAKDGTPLAGPPKVPSYRYEVRLRSGEVEINLSSLPPMT